MAKYWVDILVPAAIVGAIAAQTLGVEVSRTSRMRAWFPEQVRDTVLVDTVAADSAQVDSLSEEDFFFGEKEVVDTTPKVYARDTMRVPDSLQYTDPFLYKWYVAIKDSLTHRIVVDSLREEGDSLNWPLIDSLYLADSTATAIEKFNRWYASLSKSERKRWDYEHIKLPKSSAGRTPSSTARIPSSMSRTVSSKTLRVFWKQPSCRTACTTSAWSPGITTACTTRSKCSNGIPRQTITSGTILS